MLNKFKSWNKIGLAMIVIGGVFLLASLPFGGARGNIFFNRGFQVEEFLEFDVATEAFSAINIHTANMPVEIRTGNEFRVQARYSNLQDLAMEVRDGVLSVTDSATSLNRGNLTWIRIGFSGFNESRLIVTVPAGALTEGGSIINRNGNIAVSQIEGENLTLVTTNGRITLQNSTLDTVELLSTNGRIEVTNSTMGSLEVQTSNGRINLDRTVLERGSLRTTNGNIAVTNSDLGTASLQTSNSSITISDTTFKGGQEVRTTNGRIEITHPNEIRFEGTTTNGNVEIASEFTQGTDIVTLRSSNGRITVQ